MYKKNENHSKRIVAIIGVEKATATITNLFTW